LFCASVDAPPCAGTDINVNLRVLDDDLTFLRNGITHMPSAVVATDLMESPEPRTRRAGTLLLEYLPSSF
jgi:hypothetical protein